MWKYVILSHIADLLHCDLKHTRKRSWLRHYATSQKVAGSSPDEVDFIN
jgi:hypothetical protein